MKFLLDANLPRAGQAAFVNAGTKRCMRDIGLGDANDDAIAAAARGIQERCWLRAISILPACDPIQYPGILVLRIPDDAVAREIADLLADFVRHTDLSRHIPGHWSSWNLAA